MRKNSNSVCYHYMRENTAVGESLTTHIPTDDNCEDFFTKVLYGRKRRYHVSNPLYDIYYDHILKLD